jgi:hypothetical protein
VFEERSMIVTPFRSGLRAASFVEFGRAASPADPRKWARLRKHVAELGLPFREPYSEWFGARPYPARLSAGARPQPTSLEPALRFRPPASWPDARGDLRQADRRAGASRADRCRPHAF